jgi:hypothetical protein
LVLVGIDVGMSKCQVQHSKGVKMDFEVRLKAMQASSSALVSETDAAIHVYERLVTARAICESVLDGEAPPAVVAVVMQELTTEARFLLLNDERLRDEVSVSSPSYGSR